MKNSDQNYLVTNNKKFPIGIHFGKFKTKSTYKPQTFSFDDFLNFTMNKNQLTLFKEQLRNAIEPINYGSLIITNKNSKTPIQNYTGFVQNAFKKAVGKELDSNILRHSWSDYLVNKIRPNQNEMTRYSEFASHAPASVLQYGNIREGSLQERLEKAHPKEPSKDSYSRLTKTQKKNLRRRMKKKK